MFAKMKHGAIYALIMAFLAQPVVAGTVVGESVDGAAAWTNALLITIDEATPVEDAIVYGVQVQDTYTGSLLTNELAGAISASSSSTDGVANAYGIYLGVITADLINIGDISAASTVAGDGFFGARAWGINAGMAVGDIDNAGDITVTATSTSSEQAIAVGILTNTGTVTNDGTITTTASAIATDGTAMASGIDAIFMGGGSIVNTGTIVTTSSSDIGSDAIGVTASFDFLNTGTVKALSIAISDPFAARGAAVSGGNVAGSLSNSGTIVAGSTGEASGFDLSGSGSVTNTGEVRVAGSDGTYGIFLRGGTWDIANPGVIQGYTASDLLDEDTWTVTGAFRTLRVGQDEFSVPVAATLTDDFQITFNGDPDSAEYVIPIFVAAGSTLNLNSQNLIATPGSAVVLNKIYQVIENEGTVIGSFGGLVAGNPAIVTAWSGTDNGENAKVIFGYVPEVDDEVPPPVDDEVEVDDGVITPTPSLVVIKMVNSATDQVRQFAMSKSLRGTDVNASAEGGSVIVRPWASSLDREKQSGLGYDAKMAGVLAGYEAPITDDLVLGGHVVAGMADVDFKGEGYSSNNEDQDLFGIGAHGRYTPGNWHVDGMLTTYMVNHDYDGLTGLNLELEDKDEYESYGIEGSLLGGYKFRHGNVVAMPFVGLGYSWLNTPGHETETETGEWQTKYGDLDEHNVRAITGVRVSADFDAFDGTITPSLGLRYEHSLTDNDIRIHQTLQSASATVKGDRADGSVILDAGLTYGRGPLALEVGGAVEKNDDYDAQSGFIGVRWTF